MAVTLRRSLLRMMLALLAGGALALVVSWTGSEAATTTTTTPSTTTVTSTHTVTSTTTTTATAPTQTTTTTETKTAPGATTTIHNQTTTVQTSPATQTSNTSSSVPTWAWVVMAVEALAILALIFLLVRERDLRALAERRLSEAAAYPPATGYRAAGSTYTGQESEYPTERQDPQRRGSGPGDQTRGPDRPAS